MKEITVTFENGGVFNGSANSFTLDNLITYYFTIDKNYRVQVNANTMAIELQEYQNTNGAWYGIDIITAVSVQEVQGDVTKAYLEENYYNKTEVDAKISAIPGSDVTKAWIDQNYYSKVQIDQRLTSYWSKTEADGRYVRKAGDTMTGPLIITNNEGYKTAFEANSWTIYNTEGIATLNLYNNNVNLYNSGGVYIKQGSTGSAALIRMTVNGFYIYDPDGEWVGSLAQENNYAICALHMFKNSRIAMHSGKPNTTERFLQINSSEFHLYNNVDYGAFRFYGPMVVEDKLTVQGQLNANGTTNHRGDVYIYDRWLYQYQSNKCTVQISNDIHIYNGARLVLHSGAPDTDEEYAYFMYDGIRKHTVGTLSRGFDIDAGIGSIILTSSNYMGTGVRINVPNGGYTFTSDQGSANDVDIYKSTHETFYGEEFLTTLNDWLGKLQAHIKAQSPGYQVVQTLFFNGNPFSGGTGNSGGRGGSIGSIG